MNSSSSFLTLIQIAFVVIVGLYFLNLLKSQQGSRITVDRESRKELEKLRKLREISLTEPLAEKTRPTTFEEIIGQEEGLKALRAALCGPNPQHVIIYGPPGIGKTAAARLVLEEAKKCPESPFGPDAKFVEIDATISRFDERGIADPLIGSVHDPIYQGAGPLGIAGIPQPKPGAVTKAHGGILFIDEIGELHPVQMNKLLKVLEDRKVFLESAYYNSEDPNIPLYIHDIFQNGLPADFRLVGATTRSPNEIPQAIRSRCVEIFFKPLSPENIGTIVKNAVQKINFEIEEEVIDLIKKYATNGREAVNIVQMAASLAILEKRKNIDLKDVEWIINCGQYTQRPDKKIPETPQVGLVNGLAVYGPNLGLLIEIEATAIPVQKGEGKIIVTGIVEEEEMGGEEYKLRRKGTARGSVENCLTVMRKYLGVDPRDFDIHLNFPGGIPLDGPSAGIAVATAIYSSIRGLPVKNTVAMTGEISIRGNVKPVGGVTAKIDAAIKAGAKEILIPKENYQEIFKTIDGTNIIPVERIEEVIDLAILWDKKAEEKGILALVK
ncbi:ATP-dependent protease LonB [Thermovenabulum gondwanense]|uniref:endopeptidase La n=1 Tax=Thermovenabulum gondwanense TaxID=520767 RepID=A0A162N2Z3_9FIRM|nr:ATP-dependent protease LonB [Thermovenabulum gondwanense]KYO68721.1 Lon protease 2 [Thermovenabulum gondwanense]